MAAGVTLVDPATTYIDPDVEIGADTVIHPGVVIEGQTRIGSACEIQAHVRICRLGDRRPRHDQQLLPHRWCAGCRWGVDRTVRSSAAGDTVVGEGAKIGNFVELKKTTLGPGSKANHLSYLGDATIGANVNVGAGTITCNYDGDNEAPDGHRGRRLHRQRHAADCAGDASARAPTSGAGIIDHARTCRPGRSAIARGRQSNIEGWVERKKAQPRKT